MKPVRLNNAKRVEVRDMLDARRRPPVMRNPLPLRARVPLPFPVKR